MKYVRYRCKLCNRMLTETDEFCPDCGKDGIKIPV